MAEARRSQAGLAAAALAVALAVGLTAALAARTGAVGPFVAIPGAVGTLMLAISLGFGSAVLLPPALVLLLGEYATFLLIEGGDRFAPVVAAAFLLLAELAYWAAEPRGVGGARAVVPRRVLTLLALVAGAAALAAFLLGAGGLVSAGGPAPVVLGVAAAVGALAVLLWLARAESVR
ncbi:MAG: hypothetical protein ICV64_04190 [Thermoleophilia bacterium]|nr:hypothetical protein [Thermoleophilia bacterium]